MQGHERRDGVAAFGQGEFSDERQSVDGLELDASADGDEGLISSAGSRVRAAVVKAREDLVLLREVHRFSTLSAK